MRRKNMSFKSNEAGIRPWTNTRKGTQVTKFSQEPG